MYREKIPSERVSCKWKEEGKTIWIKGNMQITSSNDIACIQFYDGSGAQKAKLTIRDQDFERVVGTKMSILEVRLKNNRPFVKVMFDDDRAAKINCYAMSEAMKKNNKFHGVLGENIQTMNRKRVGNVTLKATGPKEMFASVYSNKNRKVPMSPSLSIKGSKVVTDEDIASDDLGNSFKTGILSDKSGKCGSDASLIEKDVKIFSSPLWKESPKSLREGNYNVHAHHFSSFKFEAKPQASTMPKGPKGFPNGGADCYINATLQCLFSMPEFVKSLNMFGKQKIEETMNLTLSHLHFWRIGIGFGLKSESALLKNVKRLIQFHPDEQQDAHEFLLATLNLLDKENENNEGKYKSFRECLEIELQRTTTCINCKEQSVNAEMQNEICIAFVEKNEHLSVQDYLFRYFQPVELQHHCAKCENSLALVTSKIKQLPRILLVILSKYNKKTLNIQVKLGDVYIGDFIEERPLKCHSVKRSNSDPNSQYESSPKKIKEDGEASQQIEPSVLIDEKEDLNIVEGKENLEPHTSSNEFLKVQGHQERNASASSKPVGHYKFVGCVSHLGSDCMSGHYISDSLELDGPLQGKWFSFNDSHVEETSKEKVCRERSGSAYILFFVAGQSSMHEHVS